MLTIVGICIAVSAFGFIRTIVTAWNAGVAASAVNRMITHHSVSIIFTLPKSYRDQIEKIPGVSGVSYGNWFGGVYKDPNDFKNFFPRIAIDPETFFSLYPEFIVAKEELEAFRKERNSCIVGQKIANEHGFKIGDLITVEGIFILVRDFVVRALRGTRRDRRRNPDAFQWKYLDESRQTTPGREGTVDGTS
jgi:putative ABC transport system permease protein